jgi:hypothetical protein
MELAQDGVQYRTSMLCLSLLQPDFGKYLNPNSATHSETGLSSAEAHCTPTTPTAIFYGRLGSFSSS